MQGVQDHPTGCGRCVVVPRDHLGLRMQGRHCKQAASLRRVSREGRGGSQVVTERGLVAASEQFEEAARGDRGAMLEFCRRKAEGSTGSEAETWSFLRVMFEEDPTTCAAAQRPTPKPPPLQIAARGRECDARRATRGDGQLRRRTFAPQAYWDRTGGKAACARSVSAPSHSACPARADGLPLRVQGAPQGARLRGHAACSGRRAAPDCGGGPC